MAYYTTDRYKGAIVSSGKRKTVVDLMYNGQYIAYDIPIASGTITIDRQQNIRRSCSVVIAEPELVPDVETDILDPYGVQLVIRSGVVYSDGDEELIPMGRYYVERSEWSEALYGRIPSVTGYDAMYYMKQSPFWTPWDYSGKYTQTVIQQVISAVSGVGGLPDTVVFDPSLSNPKIPGGVINEAGASTLDSIIQLANNCGGEIYVDANGDYQVVPIPIIDETTTSADAVWTIASGDGGSLVSAKRAVTRDGVANVVVVYGPTPDTGKPQAFAIVYDTNPNSKTYIWGPFGHSTMFLHNDKLTKTTELYEYAVAMLNNNKALARSADITCLANPAMDVGDIINVIYPDSTNEVHMVNAINYTINGATMTLTTKARTSG